jgi:hypothetical protein
MLRVRPSLVVEVVYESAQSPSLDVLAKLLRIGTHDSFDAEHVFASDSFSVYSCISARQHPV